MKPLFQTKTTWVQTQQYLAQNASCNGPLTIASMTLTVNGNKSYEYFTRRKPKGLSSGANANKIIVPSGQTLSAVGHVIPSSL